MTAAAAGARPSGRLSRPRWLGALLAVSVALNLCFVGGAAWSRFHAPAPIDDQRAPPAAGPVAQPVNPQQQAAFDQYVAAILARGNRLRQATEPLMDEAWEEIAKPQPDQARVLQLLDEASSRRHDFQHEAVANTLSLLASLTPEQRAKFLADERDRRLALRHRRAEETR